MCASKFERSGPNHFIPISNALSRTQLDNQDLSQTPCQIAVVTYDKLCKPNASIGFWPKSTNIYIGEVKPLDTSLRIVLLLVKCVALQKMMDCFS